MKLIHGDCLDVLPTINKVNLVLADMPYGTTRCKWDIVIPMDELWEKLSKVCTERTPLVLFGAEPFSSLLRASNLKKYKYDWVWEKSKATNFLNAKKQPLRAHENISVFYKKPPVYNPQMKKGEAYNKGARKPQTKDDIYGDFESVVVKSNGGRYPRDVVYFKTAESEGKTFHKTQKPIKLLEYLISTYTNEGDTVLDFAMGSGSTGVAAHNLGRKFIGIEKDSDIFNVAKGRLEQEIKRKIL